MPFFLVIVIVIVNYPTLVPSLRRRLTQYPQSDILQTKQQHMQTYGSVLCFTAKEALPAQVAYGTRPRRCKCCLFNVVYCSLLRKHFSLCSLCQGSSYENVEAAASVA